MRLDELYLWYLADPSQPRYVGALHLVSAGKGVSLRYAPEWLASGFALSEDLPLIDTEFMPPGRLMAETQRAVGAVDDARPDRWGEKVIRFVDKPKRLSLMEYLYYAGDERFGALGVSTSPETYLPRAGGPLPRLEDAQHLSEVVGKIEASEPLSEIEARIIAGGGSPLGGAKPKALININGEPWVIKFFNNEPVDTPLVEHATMTLAGQAGITVAQTQIIPLVGFNAVAIRRFDRERGLRIHSISAGTAIRAGTPTGFEPQMGYPELARILRRVGVAQGNVNQRDARELFRRMVFNILMDNTDDHERNHCLRLTLDGYHELSPAFDVVPSLLSMGYQAMVVGTQGAASTLDNALTQLPEFGIAQPRALALVSEVVRAVNGWQAHFKALGVCTADMDLLSACIDRPHLLLQRQAYG